MARIAILTDANAKIADIIIPNTFSDFVKRIVGVQLMLKQHNYF